MNVLYVGISNPITPMAENIPCKTLIVETSNGTVSNTSEPCQFIITPAKPGKTQIKVYTKTTGRKKLLGERDFRTKRIPEPLATVAGKRTGFISAKFLKVQLGVVARMEGFDFDGQFTINSFTVSITRNKSIVFEKECTGARFDTETTQALQSVKAGDMFICTNIKFTGMGYNNNTLTNSVELTVID